MGAGTGASGLNDEVAVLLITNLGGFDGLTAIGAFYDGTFLSHNFAAFGYVSEVALQTELDNAGWQSVPEPSSFALFAGLFGLVNVMLRRRYSSSYV